MATDDLYFYDALQKYRADNNDQRPLNDLMMDPSVRAQIISAAQAIKSRELKIRQSRCRREK